MTRDIFNSPQEEAARIAGEFRELKEIFRDVASRLGRLEVRLKRVYPEAFPQRQGGPRRPSTKLKVASTLSSERALELYEEFVAQARKGDNDGVQTRLLSMEPGDLDLVRRELGVSLGSKKPSKKTLVSAILSRLSESVMMSQHVHRKDLIAGHTPDPDVPTQRQSTHRPVSEAEDKGPAP